MNPNPENESTPAVEARGLAVRYGPLAALDGVDLDIPACRVTSLIGPSGCGKTTLLRCFNRMNDLVHDCRMTGRCRVLGEEILGPDVDVIGLRRRVGMVFQKSNPFPMSVFENVAFGLRVAGLGSGSELEGRIEDALRRAALWEEVRDRLSSPAGELSGGQQQRLCIARAIAIRPSVLLMDEPASALDPVSTGRIEDLIRELRRDHTLILVTHNMQQAARISDFTAFLYRGRLVEMDRTPRIFSGPKDRRTEDYVTGRFG